MVNGQKRYTIYVSYSKLIFYAGRFGIFGWMAGCLVGWLY